MELVSSDAYSQPFYGILKKLDRKIVASKPRLTIREALAPQAADPDRTPKHKPGRVSPATPSPAPQSDEPRPQPGQQLAATPKQQRILQLKETIDGLSEFFEAKRQRIVSEKVSRFATRVQQRFDRKMREYFDVLEFELREDLDTRTKKRNYARRLRGYKQHLPAFVAAVQRALQATSKARALEELRAVWLCRRFSDTARLVRLLHAFKALCENRRQASEKRQKERAVAFLLKLDTYRILLKYHAFFCLKL